MEPAPQANADVVRGLIGGSPLAALLGMAVETIERDRVRVRLPYRSEVTTVADMVHGGAIAALVDVAATAAVWSGAELSDRARGTTVGLSVSYLAAARGADLVATATVIQRGRTICVCEVKVAGKDEKPVATALVTYKVG
jgi:uncharacterized protein (TIGR00369 family)